jgi:hypothetical protein
MPPIACLNTGCEHCGGHIEYPSELAGQSVQCPQCLQMAVLPPPIVLPPAHRPNLRVVSYYIRQNDDTKGPYTIGQLRAIWNAGAITGDTLYREEGITEWQPLRTIVRELEPPATPPPIPQPPAPIIPTTPPQLYPPTPQPEAKGIGILRWCLIALVGLFIIGAIKFSLDSSSSKSPKVAITASISLSGDSIRISNRDTFDWPSTSIYINGLLGGFIYRGGICPGW